MKYFKSLIIVFLSSSLIYNLYELIGLAIRFFTDPKINDFRFQEFINNADYSSEIIFYESINRFTYNPYIGIIAALLGLSIGVYFAKRRYF